MADILPINPIPIPPAITVSPGDSLPIATDARGLGRLLSSGLRTIRAWDAAGKLPAPVRIGGRVLWNVQEIRDWLAAGAPPRAVWEAQKSARRT